MTLLTYSDVVIMSFIETFVEKGREVDQFFAGQCSNLLSFLGDITDLTKIHQFNNMLELESYIKSYQIPLEFINLVYSKISVKSIDELIDVIENAQAVFDNSNNIQTNGVCFPTSLANDSFLGLFLRKNRVKWELMSFEDIGDLFDSLRKFLHNSISDSGYSNENNSLLSAAEVSIKSFDAPICEEQLHAHFDNSNRDPSALLSSSSASPLVALLELDNYVVLHPNKKHQQSMLSLGAMWIRTGHFNEAVVAIDEAMKTAHQRGDHVSVSRALLLLHHVVDQAPTSIATAMEETLMRCLSRSINLKLKSLSSEAALLFVRHKLKGSFKIENAMSNHVNSGQQYHTTIQSLWSLLLASQLYNPVQLAEVLHIYNQPKPVAAAVDYDPVDVITETDFITLATQAALVSSEAWARLGLVRLAELQCLRALRVLGRKCSFHDAVDLCARVVRFRCDTCLANGSLVLPKSSTIGTIVSDDLFDGYESAIGLGKILQERTNILFFASSDIAITRVIDRAVTYVHTKFYMALGNTTYALRHATRLVELEFEIGRRQSLAYFQAQLMHAQVLACFDINSALRALNLIKCEAEESGVRQALVEALMLRSLVAASGTISQRVDSLVDLKEAMLLSLKDNVPSVQALGCVIYENWNASNPMNIS